MFESAEDPAAQVAIAGDLDLTEAVWTDPADWEPHVDLSDAAEDWDAALLTLITAGIAETDALTGNSLAFLDDGEIVALAGQAERDQRAATALGYQVAAELARRRPEDSGHPNERGLSAYALDELALATGLARGVVCTRVAEADALTGRHPKILAALGAGLIPLPAVRRVLETTVLLDAEQCAHVETALLNQLGRTNRLTLGDMSPAQMAALSTQTVIAVSTRASTARVAKITKDLVHRVDPAAAVKREARAKTQREVRVEPGSNGMSWLSLHVPDAAAWATYERIDALARTIPDDPDDDRTLAAKRADVALDLLLKTDATAPSIPVNLQVIVDHTGCDLDSASHGGLIGEAGRIAAVSAQTVRDLLDLAHKTAGEVAGANAVPQPCPGQQVHDDEGPGPYQPSDRLRNALQARDRICVFPGCNQPARKCELDHSVRYPEGPTCSCNLGDLCVHHHHLKHLAPGWTLTNHGGGQFTWTTPTGHTHDVTPEREPPDRPDDPDPPPF